MRTNVKTPTPPTFTHEGARASRMTPLQALRRSVMSCLLFEKEFYEDGAAIADRIAALCAEVPPSAVASLAIEAREVAHLRHVPLWLLVQLCRHGSGSSLVSRTIERVIQRADEPGELLALYWKANPGKKALSAQLKLGLGLALRKFNEYQLAKYDRDGDIKLRDVLFLSHSKPTDPALYKRIAERTLATPDTWEVELSAGADKRATFERLIAEGKLGYLALLRNLRNMAEAGCDPALIEAALLARKGAKRVLPFRYVAAARAAPRFERTIDTALQATIAELPPLAGRTAVLVDVSASMDAKLSAKSDLRRLDAAATLAAILSAEELRVFSFSDFVREVPPRRGMAGVDAVISSQPHHGTALFDAVDEINRKVPHDRLIVITDEQAGAPSILFGTRFGRIQGHISKCPDPIARGYMINVASAQNGVGYGRWIHIDGFSENVLSFIHEFERGAVA